MTQQRVDRLAQVAIGLVSRVRDDDPEANQRWLNAVLPDAADQQALLYVLAAAVPVDVPWSHLTAWARVPYTAEQVAEHQRVLVESLRGARGRAGAHREREVA